MGRISLSFLICFFSPSISSSFGYKESTPSTLKDIAVEHKRHQFRNLVQNMNTLIAPFIFPQLYRCVKDNIPTAFNFRSQSREDMWLWENIFRGLPANETLGGTFLEIGGLDGIRFSNTYFFEQKLDWRGILIEGHPLNDIRESQPKRQNSAIFTVAVCPAVNNHPGNLNFTSTGGAVGAALVHSSAQFLKDWHNGGTNGFQVSCIPIQSIIDSTGLLDIDLFSLDVEGAELAVLETLDFSSTNIRVFVVELDRSNLSKDEEVRKLILSHGFTSLNDTIRSACNYKEKGCTRNEVFINPNYMIRKTARKQKQYYKYGTGVKC